MQGNPVAVQAATNWNLIGRGLTAPPPVLSPSSTVPPHSPLSAVRPATCVIAQQYCAPTFPSQCGPPRRLCYRPTVLCPHIHLSVRSAPPPVLSPNSTVPPHSPLSAVHPAACVIAQQYCAPIFTSQCGHSCKEKFFAHFENVISVFYCFLNCLIHGLSACPLLVLNIFNDAVNTSYYHRWMTVCSDVIIGLLATLRTGQRSNLLIPGGHKAFLSSPHCADRLWGPPIFLLSGYRDLLPNRGAEHFPSFWWRQWDLNQRRLKCEVEIQVTRFL